MLFGGAGADIFVWTSAAESAGTARDCILDLGIAFDQIDLCGLLSGVTWVTAFAGGLGRGRHDAGAG